MQLRELEIPFLDVARFLFEIGQQGFNLLLGGRELERFHGGAGARSGTGNEVFKLLLLEQVENLLRVAEAPGFNEQLGQRAISAGLGLREAGLKILVQSGDVFPNQLIGVDRFVAEENGFFKAMLLAEAHH